MNLHAFLKNKNGAALPIAIITILVMTILGTVILSLGVNETNQVARDLRRTQAYYAARAGADAMAQYLIDNPTLAQTIVAKTSSLHTAAGALTGGEQFLVEVEGDIVNGLVITSIGVSDGTTSTIVLEIERVLPSDLFAGAIYTKSPLDVNQMTITGDIASGGTVVEPNPSWKFDGEATEYLELVYPSPIMPTDMASADTDIIPYPGGFLHLTGKESLLIDRSYYFTEIITDRNTNLTFKTTAGKNLHIQVDRFEGKGNIWVDVTEGGRVELYITEWAEFQTPIQVTSGDAGNPGDPNNLYLILKDGATLEIDANGTFYAYIYGPNADIALQAGNTTIYGAIVGNLLTKDFGWQSSQSRVEYVEIVSDDFPLPSVIALYRNVWRDVQ